MPAVDPQVAHIVTAYGDTTRAVRDRVLQFIRSSFGTLDTYHRPDITRFVNQIMPVVAGGQRQVASLTDSYLATIEQAVLGAGRPVGVGPSVFSTEATRGVPADAVYGRVGPTIWTALSNGLNVTDAARLGLDRSLVMAATDLQLSKTHTAREVLSNNDRVIGYQRVPGGDNVCDLCETASENSYRSEDLMPIHDRCSCDVAPLFSGDNAPTTWGNQLEDQTTSGEDDGDTPVVHQHGELGPVLAVKGQDFRGPDDIPD